MSILFAEMVKNTNKPIVFIDKWEREGAIDLYKRCNIEATRILAEHRIQPKPLDVLNKIQKIIEDPTC